MLVAAPPAQATGLAAGSYQGCVDNTTRADAVTLAHCVTATITVRVVEGPNNVRYVEFSCAGVAAGDAASVTIDECSVDGVSALDVPHTAPGAANAQVGLTVASAGDSVQACVKVVANFVLTTKTADAGGCPRLIINLAT